LVFVAGQLASDFETGPAPEVRLANPNAGDPLRLQSDYMLKNIAALHQAAGMDTRSDVARIYQWFASPYPTMEERAQGNTWPRISITPYLDTLVQRCCLGGGPLGIQPRQRPGRPRVVRLAPASSASGPRTSPFQAQRSQEAH
jgi:hypothetical protein